MIEEQVTWIGIPNILRLNHEIRSFEAQSREFYTIIGTFPTFYKTVRIFFISLGSYRKPIFSRLNLDIYLYHLETFLVHKIIVRYIFKVKYSKLDMK